MTAYPSPSEADGIDALFMTNPEEALRQWLISDEARRIRAYLYRLAFTSGFVFDPDDAFSEALVKAWQRLGSFDATKGSFAARFSAIARNTAIDMLRKIMRSGPRPTALTNELHEDRRKPSEDAPSDPARREALARQRKALIARLPGIERAVMELNLAGATVAEIAARLSVTSNHVYVARCKAIKKLRSWEAGPARPRQDGANYGN